MSFRTRTFAAIRFASELGVSNNQIYVTPSQGLSGTQMFTAGFSFASLPVFTKETANPELQWRFKVKVGSLFTLSTTDLNYE